MSHMKPFQAKILVLECFQGISGYQSENYMLVLISSIIRGKENLNLVSIFCAKNAF